MLQFHTKKCNKLAIDSLSVRGIAAMAKPGKTKLQASQENSDTDQPVTSLSPVALQTQYEMYGLLLAVAIGFYRATWLHT